MRKLFISFALLIGLTAVAVAQTVPTAEQIMSRATAAIYGGKSGEATFITTLYNKSGKEQSKSSGKIYLRGESFRLEHQDIVAVYDNKTLTYHDAAEETLTISTPSSEELIQINPFHFLRSGAKGFGAKVNTTDNSYSITYTPQGKSQVKQVVVDYSKSTYYPTALQLYSKDGSRLQVGISSFRPLHKALPNTTFKLSQKDYPKSELVDLR